MFRHVGIWFLGAMLIAVPGLDGQEAGDSTTCDPIDRARRFRALQAAGDFAAARSLAVPEPRRWWEERAGAGNPWTIGPSSGPWTRWDDEFRSRGEVVRWRHGRGFATADVREENEYFELLERGWVINEVTYYFDENCRISGLLIRATGDRPPGRTDEFLAWARTNAPEEISELMPGGEIDPSGDHPARFRALLERWRVESGFGGWPTGTPEALGLDSAPLHELDAAVRAGRHGFVDALFVVRDGRVVFDERYDHDYEAASEGRDRTPHQYNYHHPDYHPFPHGRDVHTLQSVTKSITASLIGIAIGRGEIESVEAPVVSFLGDYDLSDADPRFERVTVEDLLTMRTGIEWHELDRPADSTNTTIQLEDSDDWVRFTLDQPMDADPGTRWVYNSGTSHLMTAILRSATGQTAEQYAEQHLFGPLGIEEYHWKRTPTGLPDTEGGLYLDTSDLARFGQLFLNRGTWHGRRILPAEWVQASVTRHVEGVNDQGWGYGYQWWRLDREGVDIWAGLGYGGQYLLVMPDLRMVGVANSWNLFGPVEAELLPAFIEAMIRAAGAGS